MSRLLKEIKKIDANAARTLEGADLRTDRDLQSLTREDLRDLFPHVGKFKLRRQIFDIIDTQKPINLLLQDMKAFIPEESLRVKCRMVVTGTTFDAHLQLLGKVRSNRPNLDLVCVNVEEDPNNQDYQVTIVFCPIISRIGTDVEAAMRNVTGDKPVILVIMEHKPEATSVSTLRTWHDDPNIVLHVCVFFHERKPGLLQCHQNDEAVSQVQEKLLRYSVKINQPISGNSQERNRKTSSKDSNADSSSVMSWLGFKRS